VYGWRITKKPEEIQFNCAEEDDNKVEKYNEVSEELVFYTSEHSVNMVKLMALNSIGAGQI